MRFLILSVLLSGCGLISLPSTHRNINVYDRQVDTAATEAQMTQLIDYTFSKLGHEDLFKDYDFVFTSGWISYMGPDNSVGVCDGLTDLRNKVIYLRINSCVGDSAILHEMAHVIRAKERGDGDIDHKDVAWWNVINAMRNEMMNKLCPVGYVRDKLPSTIEIITID